MIPVFMRVRAPRWSLVQEKQYRAFCGDSLAIAAPAAAQCPIAHDAAVGEPDQALNLVAGIVARSVSHSRAEDRLASVTHETYEPLCPFSKSFSARHREPVCRASSMRVENSEFPQLR